MTTRFEQRLENLQKASMVFYRRLEAYQHLPNDEGNQMALIQAYEMNLELCWKTMKDYLEQHGYTDIVSPRTVIRTAFTANVISQADNWIEALQIRNLTSHTYLQEVMQQALGFITPCFATLLNTLLEFFTNSTPE